MRFLFMIALLVLSQSARAQDLDLSDFAAGLKANAHARFEAAAILKAMPVQMKRLAATLEQQDPDKRLRGLSKVAAVGEVLSSRFSQAATAHAADQRAGFTQYSACYEAAYSLQDTANAWNRFYLHIGNTTMQEAQTKNLLLDKQVSSCMQLLKAS